MKKYQSKEVKIAIATIVSGILLYFAVNYLKGINILKPANYYHVVFSDVSGMTVSTPVFLDGYKVGVVNALDYDFNRPGHITVELSLDSWLKLPKGTSASMETSLLGDVSINLKLDKTSSTYINIGDTLPGVKPFGLMDKVTEDILPQLDVLIPRIDTILYSLQALVGNPALHQSLDHINLTTMNLEQSTRQLAAVMNRDLPAITGNLNTVSADFAEVSGNLKEIDFQQTMAAVDRSIKNLETMTFQLNNPESSLGLLLNDRTLYDNLTNTVESANSLLLDLQENPKRYVHFSIW
ncbi:MAG: MlaD family protein [Candidatus Azobacteroides sp.]|nr:MlaD family protein [Candidatus Azobacteroides sp.]